MAHGEGAHYVPRDEDIGTARQRDEEWWFAPRSGRELQASDLEHMRRCVFALAAKLPPHVDRDELESAAQLGLVLAARAFDASKGAAWSSYSWTRMTGSMLHALRRVRPGGRRFPVEQVSLEATFRGADDRPLNLHDQLEAADDVVATAGDRADLQDLLAAIDRLPPREREALLAELRGESMVSVAARFEVSESRVSQLKAAARRRLLAAA